VSCQQVEEKRELDSRLLLKAWETLVEQHLPHQAASETGPFGLGQFRIFSLLELIRCVGFFGYFSPVYCLLEFVPGAGGAPGEGGGTGQAPAAPAPPQEGPQRASGPPTAQKPPISFISENRRPARTIHTRATQPTQPTQQQHRSRRCRPLLRSNTVATH